MPKLTFSCLFLLVLLVSVVSMGAGEDANGMCSVELDPKACDVITCKQECLLKYKGVGQCSHFGTYFHCICIYFCP